MSDSSRFIITIDQGNTLTKCALFTWEKNLITTFDFSKLDQILKEYNLSNSNTKYIKSSVTSRKEALPLGTINSGEFFKDNHYFEMPVHYNNTLGIDRLIVAYFCFLQDSKSYLIIDSGTFTTVDSVDIKGFNGGYILPGLNTLEKSYANGSQLEVPNTINTRLSYQFPKSTKEAIAQGAVLTFLAPLKEVILQTTPKNIILTGGNSSILKNYFEDKKEELNLSSSQIILDENLVHKALIAIYFKTLKEGH